MTQAMTITYLVDLPINFAIKCILQLYFFEILLLIVYIIRYFSFSILLEENNFYNVLNIKNRNGN